MTQSLEQIVAGATADFAACTDAPSLENAKAKYLGKTGAVTELLKGMAALTPEEKKTRGAEINAVKTAVEAALKARRDALANDALKAKLTGSGSVSLGKAIKQLAPDADAKTEAKKANKEASEDLNET